MPNTFPLLGPNRINSEKKENNFEHLPPAPETAMDVHLQLQSYQTAWRYMANGFLFDLHKISAIVSYKPCFGIYQYVSVLYSFCKDTRVDKYGLVRKR